MALTNNLPIHSFADLSYCLISLQYCSDNIVSLCDGLNLSINILNSSINVLHSSSSAVVNVSINYFNIQVPELHFLVFCISVENWLSSEESCCVLVVSGAQFC